MSIVDYYFIEVSGFQVEVNDLENHIVRQDYSLQETTAVLKSLLADSINYKFVKTKRAGYFKFGGHMAKHQGQLFSYQSIAQELKIKSDKISHLGSHVYACLLPISV